MLEKIISLSNKSLFNLLQNKKQELIYSSLLELLEHELNLSNVNDKEKLRDIHNLRNLIEKFANTTQIDLRAFLLLAKKRSFFTLLNIELTHSNLVYEDAWLSFKTLLQNALFFLIAYYLYVRIIENLNFYDKNQSSDEEYDEWLTKKKDLIWNCCFHNSYENNPYLEPFLLAKLTKNNKGLYSFWATYMTDIENFLENLELLKKTTESIAPNEFSEFIKFKKEFIKQKTDEVNIALTLNEIKKEETKDNINDQSKKEDLVETNKENLVSNYEIQEKKNEITEKQTIYEVIENKTKTNADILKVVNSFNEINENERLTLLLNKIKTDLILAGYSILSKELIYSLKLDYNIELISNLLYNNNLTYVEIYNDNEFFLIAYKASNILNNLEELIRLNHYLKLVTFAESKFVVIAYMLENQIIRKATFDNQAMIVLSKLIENALDNNVVIEIVFYDNELLLSLTDKLNEKEIMFSLYDNEDSISLIINGEKEDKTIEDVNLVFRIDFDEDKNKYFMINEKNNLQMHIANTENEIIREVLKLLQNTNDVIKLIINVKNERMNNVISEFEKLVNLNGNIFFSKLNDMNTITYYIYNIGLAIDKLKTDINNEIKNNINMQILSSVNIYENYVNKKDYSPYFNNLIQIFSLLNKYNESKKLIFVRDILNNKSLELSNDKKTDEVNDIVDKTSENLIEEKTKDNNATENKNLLEIPDQINKNEENKNDSQKQALTSSKVSQINENKSVIDIHSINFEEHFNKQQVTSNVQIPKEEHIFEPQTFKNEKNLEAKFSNEENKTVEKNAINNSVIDNIIDSVIDTSTKNEYKEKYVDMVKNEEKIIDIDNKKTETKLNSNAEFIILNKTERKEFETSDSLIDRLIEEITKDYRNDKNISNEKEVSLKSLEPEENKIIFNISPDETTETKINKSSTMKETDILSNYQEDQKTNLLTTTTSLLDNELKKLESFEKTTKESIEMTQEIKTNLEELIRNQNEIIDKKQNLEEPKEIPDFEKKDLVEKNIVVDLEQTKENKKSIENYVITHVDKKLRPQVIGQLNYFYSDKDSIVDIRKSADGKIYRLTLNIKDLVLNGDYKKEDLEHVFKIHVDEISYFWNLSNNKLFLDDLNCELNPKTFLIGMPNSKYISEYTIDNIAEDAFYFYSALLMLANDLLNSSAEELNELIQSSSSNLQVTEIKPIVEDLLHRVFKRIFNP